VPPTGPLTCDGVDTWGSYSLTLIDALSILATLGTRAATSILQICVSTPISGNYSEFQRVYDIIAQRPNFDSDINVSVFETNIRILGGLLAGHLLAFR
jgi:mannosidase alpha-like ER degradation enhancer 2